MAHTLLSRNRDLLIAATVIIASIIFSMSGGEFATRIGEAQDLSDIIREAARELQKLLGYLLS